MRSEEEIRDLIAVLNEQLADTTKRLTRGQMAGLYSQIEALRWVLGEAG